MFFKRLWRRLKRCHIFFSIINTVCHRGRGQGEIEQLSAQTGAWVNLMNSVYESSMFVACNVGNEWEYNVYYNVKFVGQPYSPWQSSKKQWELLKLFFLWSCETSSHLWGNCQLSYLMCFLFPFPQQMTLRCVYITTFLHVPYGLAIRILGSHQGWSGSNSHYRNTVSRRDKHR